MTSAPFTFDPQLTTETFGKRCSEALGLWESGWRIWADYLTDLSSAASPDAVVRANCRLFVNCMAAPGFAVGEMQRDTGLTAPTLNA